MYRVLIAEDEIIVREWLKKRVNWEAYDLEVCAEASNGQEALALYEKEKPDIILTDVRMPLMDGITLLQKIRQKDSRVRFLILTCLDEFALVKQAIELEVTSYILKLTSEPDEIEENLVKACNILKQIDGNAGAQRITYKDPGSERMNDTILPGAISPGAMQNPRFRAALNYLQEHYADNISLLQVADQVGVTPNYLGKLFLKYCSGTFTDELNKLRIKEAKRLLDDPSCRVYEVAEKIGFMNTTYFFRVFKKYEGCTPTEYRSKGGLE